MAGYEALGKAKRNIAEYQRKTDIGLSILNTIGSVLAFGSGQAERSKTAWEEYESGYEALGGDPENVLERGGFFKQLGQTLVPGGEKGFFGEGGYFKMPEGEVTIKDKIYDREAVRKVGSFLSGEVATYGLLGDDKDKSFITRYLELIAPGKSIEDKSEPKDTSSIMEKKKSLWESKILNNRNRISYR
tara:strand:+ start:190 stop:753 length:564 start_codon:yes stop_codon:yes gene_type:complete